MLKHLLLLTFFSVWLNHNSSAYTYGGSGNDNGIHFTKTSDGGYLLAGIISMPNKMIYLIKLDSVFSTQWTKTIGDTSLPNGVNYVAQAADSGFVIMGTYDDNYGNGTPAAWMIKTNSTGDSLYSRQYSNSMWANWGEFAHVMPDGTFLLGMIGDDATASNPLDIFRTDSAGNELWRRTINGSSYFFSYPSEYLLTRDSALVVASTNSVGPWYPIVYKLDFNGNLIFQTSFPDYNTFRRINSYGICERPDSGYIMVGDGDYFTGINQAFCMQLNSVGDSVQTLVYDLYVIKSIYGIQETIDGNFIMGGVIDNGGQTDVRLVKINPVGDTLWTTTYGGSSNDRFNYMEVANDGGFIIIGDSALSANNSDIWLIKTDSTGNINYSVSINIAEELEATVFPNPFTNSINVQLNNYDESTIMLISSKGKVVKSITSHSSNTTIDTSLLPAGIYTMTVKGKNTTSHRLVKVN